MFLSWYRRLARVAAFKAEQTKTTRRHRLPVRLYYPLIAELLEDRIAPAATITIPTTGFAGTVNTTVMSYPISIANLTDGTHLGLASANLAVTFPTGVFNLPVGGGAAISDVNLGSIPTAHGGVSNWAISANSTADGLLNIQLSARPGDQISSTAGGSLVTINFPVVANPSTPTNETIKVAKVSGTFVTSVVGFNGTYTNASLGLPATGIITINPTVAQPPTIVTSQSYSTESNNTLNQSSPNLLTGASDPQGQALKVNTINGAAYSIGIPITLPSGAMLAVNSDGSFTYVPASNFVGADPFTFTVSDTGGNVSTVGTVTVNVVPTLSIVPNTISSGSQGTVIQENVVLDNPYPASGAGPLQSFNLAITYDSSALTTAADGSQILLGLDIPPDWIHLFSATYPGLISISAFGSGLSSDLITGPAPIVLATIDFTITSATRESTPLHLVGSVDSAGGPVTTLISGANGSFLLNPELSGQLNSAAIVTNGGSNYTLPPVVFLIGGGGNGADASAVLNSSGQVQSLLITNQGGGYTSAPTVFFFNEFGASTGFGAAATVTVTPLGAFVPGVDTMVSIQGAPPLTLSPSTLPQGDINHAYTQTIAASGGTAPYTFKVSSGTLPTWLTLDGYVGVLSGTPTMAGSYAFTITATDSVGFVGSQSYSVTINPPVTLPLSGPSTLATFNKFNGYVPSAGLVEDSSGNLFGTTVFGGAFGAGTVFEIVDGSGSITTLASFNAYPEGGLVEDSSGNLFGTTTSGGAFGSGTVFEIVHGSGSITTLASFNNSGVVPQGGLVEDSSGNLFGTTSGGGSGASDDGTVFEIVHGSGSITTLASFNGANGDNPQAGLVEDSSGNLFGTTEYGGIGYMRLNSGFGTVFEVKAGSDIITTLASFNGTNGANPTAGLVEDSSGNLFGTTSAGGASDLGTVFETVHSSESITPLASFGGNNGVSPNGSLVEDSSGNLFGTAQLGGISYQGTVFEIVHGTASITPLASFGDNSGVSPNGGLVEDSSGNLFGTTEFGGAFGAGTVFSVRARALLGNGYVNAPYSQTLSATGGTGQLTFTGGSLPPGLTLASSGLLTGTPTTAGTFMLNVTATDSLGASDTGFYTLTINPPLAITTTSLLSWTINQPGYSQTINAVDGIGSLTFSETGSLPTGLTLSTGGVLSGTPTAAGSFSFTVTATDSTSTTASSSYTVTINAASTITTTSLTDWTVYQPGYSQTISATGGTGGITFAMTSGSVLTGLTLSSSGVLSGTPAVPGTYSFTVTATDSLGASGPGHSYTVTMNPPVTQPLSGLSTLATFNGSNGYDPSGGLIEDSSGNFFGTTASGGASDDGTVFEIVHGSGSISTLAAFNGSNGVDSRSGVVEDSSGNLFGTTEQGGASDDGTVFEIVHGSGSITTLAAFNGSNGAFPHASLVEDSSGNLFGTTFFGGASDDGTVFEIVHGSGSITTLAAFNRSNGAFPQGPLVEDSSGNLFATTEEGGASNDGTVFEIAYGSGSITTLASFNNPTSSGGYPYGGLVEDSSGNLFGTTSDSGPSGEGTVFEIVHGSGSITPLAAFNYSTGASPEGPLVVDSSGNLFGTTTAGGSFGYGTVFEIVHGSGSMTGLHSFGGYDGADPYASLLEDSSGNLFGITGAGGVGWNGNYDSGDGTVFAFRSRALANGDVNAPYSQTLNATGGTGQLTFTGGPLPPGLTLASSGLLTGTPTTAGTFMLNVTATDSLGASDTGFYTLTINPPLAITTTNLLSWTINQPGYSQTIQATGGSGSYTFKQTAGTLPTGLTLSTTGILSGTPTAAGSFSFTVTATDSVGATASQSYTLSVNSAVSITTATLANGVSASAYNETISATGGTGALAFSAPASSLPPGLTLTSAGVLSGTPTTADSYTFTVTATDSVGATGSTSYTVVIALPGTVYVDPSFTGSGDPGTDPGLGLIVGSNAFSTITAGLANIAASGTLVIFGGTYSETAVNFNVPLSAVDVATNPSDSPVASTVTINGKVTLSVNTNFEQQGAPGVPASTAANLVFGFTVDGPGSLTVDANMGLTFDGPMGDMTPLASLTDDATTTTFGPNATMVTTSGDQDYDSPVILNAPKTTFYNSGRNLNFYDGIMGAASTSLDVPAGTAMTLSGTSSFGSTTVEGTLTVNGSLTSTLVSLDGPSAVLNGTGSVLDPVVVTAAAGGASISAVTIKAVAGTGIDIQPGANHVTVMGVTVTGCGVGILAEPGSGNSTIITGSTLTANLVGLEVLNGCITVTGNIIGGASGQGNNVGVYLPATNPNNAAIPVNPLLTLEGNNISGNATGMQNSTAMGVTAILNWWGNSAGPGATDALGRNPVVGLNVNDYTPYALDATSVGPNPTSFNFFNGTGSDGNVYVTGTLGADSIQAMVDAVNSNVLHVTGLVSGDYTRGGAGNRLIMYGFGDIMPGTRDTITVNGSWNAEIHAAALSYREPLSFGGTSSSTITTLGSGSDVIFGGGNDNISAGTSGNNVIVAGLSTGKTGAPAAPRLSGGSGSNLYLAGSVDCALAPMATSGRLDYATLRNVDDLWASGMGGVADAMTAAALFSVANTPGAILTGTARATISATSGKNWFILKGAGNPSNGPAGLNSDYLAGSTAYPNYRQAIQ